MQDKKQQLQPDVEQLTGSKLGKKYIKAIYCHPAFSVIQRASLVAQMVKHLPAMQETQVRSSGRESLLEEDMAPHSSTVAWKIP